MGEMTLNEFEGGTKHIVIEMDSEEDRKDYRDDDHFVKNASEISSIIAA